VVAQLHARCFLFARLQRRALQKMPNGIFWRALATACSSQIRKADLLLADGLRSARRSRLANRKHLACSCVNARRTVNGVLEAM
jgi:hypothetical protein